MKKILLLLLSLTGLNAHPQNDNQEARLFKAIRSGNLEEVKKLTAQGVYLGSPDESGRTGVDYALEGKNLEMKDYVYNFLKEYRHFEKPKSEIEFSVIEMHEGTPKKIKAVIISCKSSMREQKPKYRHKTDKEAPARFKENQTVEFVVARDRGLKLHHEYEGVVFQQNLKTDELIVTENLEQTHVSEKVSEFRKNRKQNADHAAKESTRNTEHLDIALFDKSKSNHAWIFKRKDRATVKISETFPTRYGEPKVYVQKVTFFDHTSEFKTYYASGQLKQMSYEGIGGVPRGNFYYFDEKGYLTETGESKVPEYYNKLPAFISERKINIETSDLLVGHGQDQKGQGVWNISWKEKNAKGLVTKHLKLEGETGKILEENETVISKEGDFLSAYVLPISGYIRLGELDKKQKEYFPKELSTGFIKNQNELKEFWKMVIFEDSFRVDDKIKPELPKIDFSKFDLLWSAAPSAAFSSIQYGPLVETKDKILIQPYIHFSDYGSHYLDLWMIPKTIKKIEMLNAITSADENAG